MKPRLLDLFAGAGGSAVGYARAGFEVVGVDIEPQPSYPFKLIEADAMVMLQQWSDVPGQRVEWGEFDAIHASPPCQGYTPMTNRRPSSAPRLIPPLRALLKVARRPYVIENVPGAPLENSVRLCGQAFDLGTYRHRLFESNVSLWGTPCYHDGERAAVYGPPDGRRIWTRTDGSELRAWASLEEGKAALGVPWMNHPDEVREAIPPAFTEFVGSQLIDYLRSAA